MRRAVVVSWLLGLVAAMPLSAQETSSPGAAPTGPPDEQLCPAPGVVADSEVQASTSEEVGLDQAFPWRTAWGVGGIRAIPAGPRVAPNGVEYHPNFSMDLNINCWIWRRQGLYLFGDMRFWGEKGEFGVTNARDGAVGTSKREFDVTGGVAWNYAGPWEARVFGYSYNNLNRGDSQVTPSGFNDGFALENRYYLSPEYAKLGQTGFDVAKATFLSVGYYPSREMVGNDGTLFKPGLFLRAYLTCDLGNWPVYAFGDATFLTERSLQPKLLLFDVGFAARPFRSYRQLEFRLGVENTADVQVRDIKSLWYAAVRYVF
jgi:hypothetical protein